ERLTKALVDMGAGSGLTGDVLQRVTMSLGQIHTQGKITGMEVRELARAGVPIKSILAKSLGVTTAQLQDMLDEGLVPVGDAMERVISWMEESFPNAAEKQAKSWGGLKESLKDLKQLVMREFFTPIMEPFRPIVAGLVDTLVSEETRARLRRAGEQMGRVLKLALAGDWRGMAEQFGVPKKTLDDIGRLGDAWDRTWGRIEGIWNKVEPKLAPIWGTLTGGLGTELAKWPGIVADKLGLAGDELGKLENWLRGQGGDASLCQVGVKIAGLVVRGIAGWLLDSVEGLASVSDKIRTWAESAETQQDIARAGSDIGSALADGIIALLGSDEAGKAWAAGLGIGLGKMLRNIDAIMGAVTGQLASSFFTNFFTKLGLSAERVEELKNVYRSAWEADTDALSKAPWVALNEWAWRSLPEELPKGMPWEEQRYKSQVCPESPWDKFYREEVLPSLEKLNKDAATSSEAVQTAIDASVREGSDTVAKLWQEDARRRIYTKEELEALEQLPQPAAWSVERVLELQHRIQAMQAEYDRLLAAAAPVWESRAWDVGRPSGGLDPTRGYAAGLDRVFTQPTYFQGWVAEHAPERVHITPAGGGSGSVTVNIGSIVAPGGPAQVRRATEHGVLQALHASGVGAGR
ncbi:MAG TPA: tape measure protein, partial [Anaerolineae bacterium]|nr:tape measure protein [Anaerolineae bacterium]